MSVCQGQITFNWTASDTVVMFPSIQLVAPWLHELIRRVHRGLVCFLVYWTTSNVCRFLRTDKKLIREQVWVLQSVKVSEEETKSVQNQPRCFWQRREPMCLITAHWKSLSHQFSRLVQRHLTGRRLLSIIFINLLSSLSQWLLSKHGITVYIWCELGHLLHKLE